jgi:chaperonin GroEL
VETLKPRLKRKKDRVEDALYATKAAIEEGIVAGGGAALLYAREAITESNIGSKIVHQACGKPFEQILVNAGYDKVKAQMLAMNYTTNETFWEGHDVKTGMIIDMKEAGIIDPAKVTRTALENAASVAGTVLLTECVVVDSPEDKKDDSMGGMGGMF